MNADNLFLHVEYALDSVQLPVDCIRDCSASGDVSQAVEYWRNRLNLTVNRERAIECLKGYGAWDDETLAASSNNEIAERILWLACCDFSEYNTWIKRNPDKSPQDADYGSDVFVLE